MMIIIITSSMACNPFKPLPNLTLSCSTRSWQYLKAKKQNMIVNIIKSSIVFPLEKTKPPRRRLWLSNLDLLHGRVHVPVLCMYKLQENHHFLDAKLLKEALSKVLALFYPMAGRLGRDDNGRLEIDCNGQGVLFREADSDFQLSQVAESMPSSELLKLVPTVDYSQHFSSYPLLLLQVTRFKCGGAILGIGIHHSLADGESTISFINTWSNMVHGLPPTIVPFLDRTLLQASNPPSPKFHHIEYDSPPSLINNPIRPKPTSKSIFKFTPRQLNALRAKANPSNNNDSGSRSRYSTYQILTAHIWRCVSRARGLPDDQPTRLHISVDGRARLNPPVPSGYFGNVIFHATPVAMVGELVSETTSLDGRAMPRVIKSIIIRLCTPVF